MKLLYLLRHAKSDQDDSRVKDHDRPLSPRGIDAMKLMRAYLEKKAPKIDAVYCSTSRRTRETYDLVKAGFGQAPVTFSNKLYLMEPGSLLEFVQELPSATQAAALIGHNPGFHILAADLAKDAAEGHAKEFATLQEKFPTGTFCSLSFNVASWRDIKAATGQLTALKRPRDLE